MSNQVSPKVSPWSARRPVLLGSVALAILIGGFGAWSTLTTIAGAVVSPGMIEVAQNRQVVQHPDGGVVAEIAVKESQKVQAGDLLIRLDGSSLLSELAIVEGQYFELLAQKARLEAERIDAAAPVFPADLTEVAGSRVEVATMLADQISLFAARQESLARQTEQLQKRGGQIASQIDGIKAQNGALSTQLELIQSELTDQETLLAKGLTQAGRVMELQRGQAQLMGDLGKLTAAKAEAEGRATEVALEILRLAAVRRETAGTELRTVGGQALELSERRRAVLERIERLDIRAPSSGIVLGLSVTTPRSVIRPAEPILYVIPQDRPLVISAQVMPLHIDEVRPGQAVHIAFSALSGRTTPQLNGHVSSISADALTDQRTQAPYFRAEIVLDEGELAKLNGQTLLPGMPVETFIQTGLRSPMAYFLKPFTDYFSTAMRES
ncbi:MAG: HlyD family type I secretion periplasmic adaptor subunit [Microgenomates group bacterium]